MALRYKIIGNVALIRIDKKPLNLEKIIQIMVTNNPKIIAVLGYKGIYDEYRTPLVELLWGNLPNMIKHSEYGVHYYLDPSKLMFSLGNLYERLRIASLVRSWEIVVDMFAGVGQFTLPIAVHSKPSKIHSIEINPLAYEYLVKNIKINSVEGLVVPYLSDCREQAKRLEKIADRIIMGYLHDTVEFLPYALNIIRDSGGIIHLHQLIDRNKEEQLVQKVINLSSRLGYVADILSSRIVKSYSAKKIHVVIDFFVISRDRLRRLDDKYLDT